MSSLIFNNVSTSPATVGTGKSQLYVKNGEPYKQSGTDSERLLGGKIGQTVYEYADYTFSNTSTSMISTGLSATITPSSASSFIRATFVPESWDLRQDNWATGSNVSSSSYEHKVRVEWRRSIDGAAHTVTSDTGTYNSWFYTGTHYQRFIHIGFSLVNIDRPATTSSITYTVTTGCPDQSWSYQMNNVGEHFLLLEELLDPQGSLAT